MAVANSKAVVDRHAVKRIRRDILSAHAGQGHAPIVRRLGGFYGEWSLSCNVKDPIHYIVALRSRNLLQHFAASNRDQEKETPSHYRQGLQQFVNPFKVIHSLLRDQRIDLDR